MGKKKAADDGGEEGEKPKIKRQRLLPYQLETLENTFQENHYPSTQMKEDLAAQLQLKQETVSKWFINRRVKMRESEKSKDKEDDREKEREFKKFEESVLDKNEDRAEDRREMEGIKKALALAKKKMQEPKEAVEPPPEEEEVTPEVLPPLSKEAKAEEIEFWKKWRTSHSNAQIEPNEEEQLASKESVYYETEDRPKVLNGEYLDDQLDSLEEVQSRAIDHLPLWKQLYVKNAYTRAKPDRTRLQQKMFQHIVKMREAQGLLPFFAMITGPTIRPYRMEELRVVLGRITPSEREADIHLGLNSKISAAHVAIEFDREYMCYKAVNLTENGFAIKVGNSWIHCKEVNKSMPLPNPTALYIGGVVVYFQVFFIRDLPPPPKPKIQTTKPTPTPASASSEKSLESELMPPPKKPVVKGKPYAQMIEQALISHGGQATYKEIKDYIIANFKEEVADRKTWQNSVAGVLSTNPLFESEPLSSENSGRGRGSIWRLTRGVEQQDKSNGEASATAETPSASEEQTENTGESMNIDPSAQ